MSLIRAVLCTVCRSVAFSLMRYFGGELAAGVLLGFGISSVLFHNFSPAIVHIFT